MVCNQPQFRAIVHHCVYVCVYTVVLAFGTVKLNGCDKNGKLSGTLDILVDVLEFRNVCGLVFFVFFFVIKAYFKIISLLLIFSQKGYF